MSENFNSAFELIPAYASGALDDDERQRVEALLAESDVARAELRTYQAIFVGVAQLTSSAPSLSGSDRQRLQAGLKARLNTPLSAPDERPHERITAPLTRIMLRRALIAAVAIFILGIAIWGVVTWSSSLRFRQEQDQIDNIIGLPNIATLPLEAQPNAVGAVRLLQPSDQTRAVIVSQLPALPSDRQYQLWLIVGQAPQSLIVFTQTDPECRRLFDLPSIAEDYAVGLTIEPYGGSPAPTTAPIFIGRKAGRITITPATTPNPVP